MFEDITEYLTRLRDFTKIKLLYIIRKTLIPLLSADNDENNYVYKDAEMIACATILERGTIAAADEDGLALHATNMPWDSNALIYQRVVYVVMQNKIWTHPVWKFTDVQRRSNVGSVVYWICYNKILGQSMVDNMDSKLLSDIQALVYRGESRNGTFEKYEAMHVAFNNKGQWLVAFVSTIIDERILIDAFTAGITGHALDVVKANFMARPELVSDFYAVSKCYDD